MGGGGDAAAAAASWLPGEKQSGVQEGMNKWL